MSRYVLRTVAMVAGLTLGFVCAGYVSWPSLLGPAHAQTAASEASGHAQAAAPTHEAEAMMSEAHVDEGQAAAGKLVPRNQAGQPAMPGGYPYVAWGIAGLFAAALGVGIPLTRLGNRL